MELIIKYENGQMTIRMDSFFPTSQRKLMKLLNVIELDCEHKDEHIQTLKQYFNDKLQELESKRIDTKKKYKLKEQYLMHLEILEQRK